MRCWFFLSSQARFLSSNGKERDSTVKTISVCWTVEYHNKCTYCSLGGGCRLSSLLSPPALLYASSIFFIYLGWFARQNAEVFFYNGKQRRESLYILCTTLWRNAHTRPLWPLCLRRSFLSTVLLVRRYYLLVFFIKFLVAAVCSIRLSTVQCPIAMESALQTTDKY